MTAQGKGTGTERGAALVLTVMVVALVAGLGGALLMVTSIETSVQTHHFQAHAVRQAAEAGLACAISELRRAADWTPLLAGDLPPNTACLEPAALPPPWAHPPFPTVGERTGAIRAETASRYGPIPDMPAWTLRAAVTAPAAAGSPPPIVLVWIADDAEDGDGDPATDTNGIVWVRTEAWGLAGARASVEAIIRRGPDSDPPAFVAGWRAVR